MTRPYSVARALEAKEIDSFGLALKKMADFSDAELHQAIVTANTGGSDYRMAAGLCHAELDRRSQAATHDLAMKTTRWAASIGAVAGIAGAIIGAVLTAVLGS